MKLTNKEASEWLIAIKRDYIHGGDEDYDERRKLALDMGAEALENQKTGHWVLKRTFPTKLYEEYLNEYECSKCYRKIRCTESQLINYPYCHCGAKMEGE